MKKNMTIIGLITLLLMPVCGFAYYLYGVAERLNQLGDSTGCFGFTTVAILAAISVIITVVLVLCDNKKNK